MRYINRNGRMVWENSQLEDLRDKKCLCHTCGHRKLGAPDACTAAARLREICQETGCAAILTRCPNWTPELSNSNNPNT
jgi:hypothetical protein